MYISEEKRNIDQLIDNKRICLKQYRKIHMDNIRPIGPPPGNKDWVDTGTHWLNILNQGTDGWRSARRNGWGYTKALLTASNFGTSVGHNKREKPESLAYMMVTGNSKERTPQELSIMNHGNVEEPNVRLMYEVIKNVKVREVGLAIPKFDIRIGASVDGDVGDDGIIEIKCPQNMYPDLIDPTKASLHPSQRIRLTHYDQMIGGMAIRGRSWCDYCVYDKNKEQLYIERVPFDINYWNTILYPLMKNFIEVIIPQTEESIKMGFG